jgi:hypothetical protein
MADAKKTTVNVTYSGIDPVTGKAKFTIKPTGTDPLPTGPDGLIFVNDHFPGFQISFVLIDDTHQNYAFPPNSSKDMAVSSVMGANQCPPQKTSDVFQIVGVSGTNNNTLTVLNTNKDKLVGIFSYVLWITNDGGKSYVPLDPGGVNQNGPSIKFPLTSVVIFAVAVAVLALVALYWLGVFNR